MKIYIVVTDIVNDVTYSRKSVNTRVVIRTAKSYDKSLHTLYYLKNTSRNQFRLRNGSGYS